MYASSPQQEMNIRIVPYVIITFISIVMSLVRLLLVQSWSLRDHAVSAAIQLITSIFLWEMVKLWNRFFTKRISFRLHPYKRIIIQTLVVFITTLPILVFVDYVVNPLFPPLPFMGKEFKSLVVLLFFIIIVLMNFSFYGYHFFKEWQASIKESADLKVYAANTEMEKSRMHFHNLKNQVNPHFLFNTLTSLDGLIQTNAELASQFVHHLAKVYRYVLEHRENEVVQVQTEVNFIKHYILLLEIRFKQSLNIRINLNEIALEKKIVMVTLQMLIDNAIKHNTLQEKKPLDITISDEGEYLIVSNNKQLRKQIEMSTQQGLKQLKELYAYLSPRPVLIINTNNAFEIRIPLL